ncbi:MAG: sugar phosphate nucleotidyltransferase [Microthrixaceae bacterium]
MQAVILVGGFGTRLRPLTLSAPKQMLPVVGVTMLERVVAKLAEAGVDDAVLSLGYKPDAFTNAFPEGTCAGVSLHYAVEPEPLDTAGAIAFAANDAGITNRFLAVNGDVLTDIDVSRLWQLHEERSAEATIALTPVEDPSRFGVVPLHDDGRVEAFIEKPDPGTAPSNWINAGTYVLEPSALGRIESGRKVSIEREVFPAMVDAGSLYGMQSDSYWIDAGTPEAYLQANLDYLDGSRGPALPGVDGSAQVADGATVTRSVIGRGSVVAAGAVIEDSVVMAGASIGSGVSLRGSIVGGGSTLGSGSDISGLSVVGTDVDVPAGTNLVDERMPGPESWPKT